ncbi:hypothetical protein ACJZ2D_011537 [Fusarium nematophilum]
MQQTTCNIRVPPGNASTTNDQAKIHGGPVPRRGHTKSRNGCLNCKRRRVKCPETFPECDHCKRLGLSCAYPSKGGLMASPSKALRSTATQFTMEDLRLFQHFIFHAYPPLPIYGETVWKEVATLSHHFEFLIHAMLGLAASHLSLCDTMDYSSQALSHRVQAIRLLNQALSKPCPSKAEAEARFAATMALAFQASHMPNGMLEFLVMLRGCTVVSHSALLPLEESVFNGFTSETHNETVLSLNQDNTLDGQLAEILNAGLLSVSYLRPICHSVLEVRYLVILESALKLAKRSPVGAFTEVCEAYAIFGDVAEETFKHFTDPDNYTAQIIMAHFFIIEYLLATIALKPVLESFPFRRTIVSAWTREVARNLPSEFELYIRWPLGFADPDHFNRLH